MKHKACSKPRTAPFANGAHRRAKTNSERYCGCVSSFRASVRYLTALGTSSKPSELAPYFASLYAAQETLYHSLRGFPHKHPNPKSACFSNSFWNLASPDRVDRVCATSTRGIALVRLSDSCQAGLESCCGLRNCCHWNCTTDVAY